MSVATKSFEQSVKHNNRNFILLMVLFLVVQIAWSWWQDAQLTIVKGVDIENVALVSSQELCPGEVLIFSYDLYLRGQGRLVRDLTTWDINPPRTLIYSSERRFIVGGAVDQDLQEAWPIPLRYYNYQTAIDEEIPPGDYVRYMSISSLADPKATDTIEVYFTIPERCYE